MGSFAAKGKKVTGEKRKWPMKDIGLENPLSMDPSSLLVASREAARVEASHLRRKVAIPLDLTSQEGGYTPDPSLMATSKQLLSHLQPAVMLMANMVSPGKKD